MINLLRKGGRANNRNAKLIMITIITSGLVTITNMGVISQVKLRSISASKRIL